MKSKNTVAQVLKVYAIINFIAGIILSIVIGKNIDIDGIGIYFFAASLVINFVIFAFGEVVQLLHDIKINTSNQTQGIETKTDDSLSSELSIKLEEIKRLKDKGLITNEEYENKKQAIDEPITVFEDDTAKIELINFYEEYVDWGDREPAYEKILTFKYYNKTDHEIRVELFQAYIGDDAILIISYDGDESISAGKTSRMRYIIQQYSETTTIALNALEDLYQLNGVFLIQNVNDEGAYEVSFSFPDLF